MSEFAQNCYVIASLYDTLKRSKLALNVSRAKMKHMLHFGSAVSMSSNLALLLQFGPSKMAQMEQTRARFCAILAPLLHFYTILKAGAQSRFILAEPHHFGATLASL